MTARVVLIRDAALRLIAAEVVEEVERRGEALADVDRTEGEALRRLVRAEARRRGTRLHTFHRPSSCPGRVIAWADPDDLTPRARAHVARCSPGFDL